MSLILDGTNGLSDVDGTAGTPAIRGSDANTGVFFGTDIVGVSTGGSERMRVDASGNVGIGTSSPGSFAGTVKTVIGGGSGSPVLTLYGGSSTYSGIYFADGTTGNELYRGFFEYNHANDSMLFGTAGSTKATLDSSGNLLVGTTSANPHSSGTYGSQLSVGGALIGVNNSHAIIAARWNGNGEVIRLQRDNTDVGSIDVTTTATSYNTSSDYRLKHDIQPMTGALAKVQALKPVTYKWNADDSDGEGFIAHELQEVCPDAVSGEKDAVDAEGNPQYQGIDTSFLVATLTAAIQEQQALIESLTARVVALEGQA